MQRPVRRLLELIAAGALVACSRPAPPAAETTARTGTCDTCHSDIALEWASSAHRNSESDPLYREAFALEPLAFCRDCHSPARDRGIGCTDCHSGHRADRTVATVGCASCHEFAFPNGTPGMQRTATEHRASAYANVSCASCHMTLVARASDPKKHTDHTFAISDAMIRSAVVADVTRSGREAVTVRLAPGEVGHAFPTGDLFRRVVVEAELLDEAGTVQASRRRDLGRTFRPDGVELSDTRLDANGATFDFDFTPIRAIARPRVHVEIAYERVAHPIGQEPDRAAVASRILLVARDIDLAAH